MERNHFICVDIGGTAIKYGILDAKGNIVESHETPTLAKEGGKALAKRVYSLCEELLEKDPALKGIAISSAGVVDSDQAKIIYASNAIPGYAGICYKDELAGLGLPVEAENDVNCAGLAEADSGVAKEADSMVMMTIGTGIGGCFVERGRLLQGHSYSACEVGYLPMENDTFQNTASTTALCRNVAARKNEPVEKWNGREIFAAAKEGDPICLEEIRALGLRLGRGIGMICTILNPQTVVLGGGIMAQEAMLRPAIEEGFASEAISLIADSTDIRFAAHENAAGMKGALVHFLGRHADLA